MIFEGSESDYAATLLQHARELYSFADTYRATYTSSIPDVVPFYNSWSGYHDELTWAAAWLYRATNESSYLDKAESHYLDCSPDPNWAQSWDGKINAHSCPAAISPARNNTSPMSRVISISGYPVEAFNIHLVDWRGWMCGDRFDTRRTRHS